MQIDNETGLTTGSAFIPMITLIHMQGIPLKHISVSDDKFGTYVPQALRDVMMMNKEE